MTMMALTSKHMRHLVSVVVIQDQEVAIMMRTRVANNPMLMEAVMEVRFHQETVFKWVNHMMIEHH